MGLGNWERWQSYNRFQITHEKNYNFTQKTKQIEKEAFTNEKKTKIA